MIIEGHVWYDVIQSDERPTSAEVGKWLHFGETAVLHSWLPRLNELVERGELLAAKISRKDPRWDPFPHKPCVLCVFTTANDDEKTSAKQLLATEFGITVDTWKSDAQTRRDWAEDGWLQVESQITAIKRGLAAGHLPETPEIRKKLRDLVDNLAHLLNHPKSDTLLAEIKLSRTEDFLAALRCDLASGELTLAMILDHLDRIQAQLSRMSDAKATHSASSDLAFRDDYLFVIMPFGKEHVDTYDAIRRTVLKVAPDFTVDRVDEKPGVSRIIEEIWNSIKSSRLIVCDLTGERPNVYYELGYAHALGRPVICVARERTTIHFDVSGFRVTSFATYRELEDQLAREMAACLTAENGKQTGQVQKNRTKG